METDRVLLNIIKTMATSQLGQFNSNYLYTQVGNKYMQQILLNKRFISNLSLCWSAECEATRLKRHSALNKWTHHKSPENKAALQHARKEADSTYTTARTLNWQNFCNQINVHTPSAAIWKQLKRIESRP